MKLQKHHLFLTLGSIAVLALVGFSDPNGGEIIPGFLAQLVTPIIAVWFAYFMRKILLPYIKLEELYTKLKETSVGSGIGFLGVCIITYAMLGLFGGQVRAQSVESYIPPQAKEHVVTLRKEQAAHWADHPFRGSSQV